MQVNHIPGKSIFDEIDSRMIYMEAKTYRKFIKLSISRSSIWCLWDLASRREHTSKIDPPDNNHCEGRFYPKNDILHPTTLLTVRALPDVEYVCTQTT